MIKDINITMIDANAYYTACHLTRAQVFVILIRDI